MSSNTATLEIVPRNVEIVPAWLGYSVVGGGVAAALVALRRRGGPQATATLVAVWGAAVVLGVVGAYKPLALVDDAFIRSRCAHNWTSGHGLVRNRGEWVHGESNLAWTVFPGGARRPAPAPGACGAARMPTLSERTARELRPDLAELDRCC